MSVVKGIPHPSHLRYSELDRYTAGTPAILLAQSNHFRLFADNTFNANEDL